MYVSIYPCWDVSKRVSGKWFWRIWVKEPNQKKAQLNTKCVHNSRNLLCLYLHLYSSCSSPNDPCLSLCKPNHCLYLAGRLYKLTLPNHYAVRAKSVWNKCSWNLIWMGSLINLGLLSPFMMLIVPGYLQKSIFICFWSCNIFTCFTVSSWL